MAVYPPRCSLGLRRDTLVSVGHLFGATPVFGAAVALTLC